MSRSPKRWQRICSQALRAAILLLDALVHEWLEILEEGGVPAGGSESPSPVPDLARLEGFGICFLCSTDPDVRRSAWDLLSSVRHLHSRLTSHGEALDETHRTVLMAAGAS